jgi:hypothetical protein
MSALDEVRQAITQKLATSGFTTTFPDVPIQFPNQPFETPDNKTYIKISIIHGDSDQAQLAKTREIDRHVGILQFDVITPLDSGTMKQNNVSDFLGKIYRRQSIPTLNAGTLIFRTPSHLVVGMERGADRVVVRIPFRRDEQILGS